MVFRKLYNFIMDTIHWATVPSKEAFLGKNIVPATTDDRHYNDKCTICWEEYSIEHPAVKLLPCGHVFGRACANEMIEGPTGDLCPMCRVKLFRRNFVDDIIQPLLVSALSIWITFAASIVFAVQRTAGTLLPGLVKRFLSFGLLGPQLWVTMLVHRCTNVESRNPYLRLFSAFRGTSLAAFLVTGLHLVPLLWPVYYILGFGAVKFVWFVTELTRSWAVQQYIWTHSVDEQFNNLEDCWMVERLVQATIVGKGIILAICLWSRLSGTVLASTWNVLANVAWR